MIEVPELTKTLADQIGETARRQLTVSRQFKLPRMTEIGESEDLYFGVVKKTIKNPFKDPFPYMSGFVDKLVSDLDDPPQANLEHNAEADLKSARKYEAYITNEMTSKKPNAMWAKKDRWCKKFAIFSGFGVYCLYADATDDSFTMYLDIVDYYDWHCEPNGGGDLEEHYFCGRENIFKTEQQLLDGAKNEKYDQEQIAKITGAAGPTEYKDAEVEAATKLNRYRAMGLDPDTHNFVGQKLHKLAEWYLTFQGVRWYCLFDIKSGNWIRIVPLRKMYPVIPETGDALWPFVAWHTHEEGRLFYSKAPADDARPIAKNINRIINQELYNREKQNAGKYAYDPTMYEDYEALNSWDPDQGVPYNSQGGKRKPQDGLYKFQVGELSSTINLVTFLDSFGGQKTATTAGSMGQAPADQKVGIYFGELKQIQGRLGLYNKSYREAWEQLIYRAILLIDKYLTTPIAIKTMGAKGVEWNELTPADKVRVRDFGIKISGGNEEKIIEQEKRKARNEALKGTTTVDPKWKDKEMLKNSGYSDEELKSAWSSQTGASEELLAEAAQAIDQIVMGRIPKLNYSANVAYAEKLLDEALKLDDEKIQEAIYDYITAHSDIIARNEARTVNDLLTGRNLREFQNGAGTVSLDKTQGGGGIAIPQGNQPVQTTLPADPQIPQGINQ